MHSGKQYDCRAAMIAVCMAMAADIGKPVNLKGILKANTDIPEERLDFATAEIGQTLFGLKQMVRLGLVMCDSEEARLDMFEGLVGGAVWTDDDKRDLSIKAYLEEVEGEPLVTVKTKLKKVKA